jgi:O-antigen/teichoic acid export membrane protein
MDKQKVAWQVGVTYATVILGILISPLLPFILTRTLSLEDYGVYSLFFAFVQLLIVLFEFGLSQYILTKLPGEQQRLKHFISIAAYNVFFFVIGILLMSLLKNVFLKANKLEMYPLIYTISLAIIFFGMALRLLYAYFFAKKDVVKASMIDFFKNSLWVIMIIAFYFMFGHLSLSGVFLIWLFSLALVFIITFIAFSSEIKKGIIKNIDFAKGWQGWRFSIPLFPAILASWFMSLSDRYIINHFENASQVALYALPYSILGVILTLGSVVTTVLYPYFVHSVKKAATEKENLLRTVSIKYGLLLILPATAGLIILRKEIITLVSGPQYLASAALIPILCFYPLFAFLAFVTYQHVLSQHKTFIIGIVYTLGAVINVVLNLFLVPRYSLPGAAFSTLTSYIVIWLGLVFFTKKKMRLNWNFMRLGRIILATAGMTLVLVFFHPFTFYEKIGVIILGAVVYACLLFALKVFSPEEHAIAKRFFLENKIMKRFRP